MASLQTWLIIPTHHEDSHSCRFFSLKEDRVYIVKDLPEQFRKSRCVGSSHGWLLLLNQEARPYLLNPFFQHQIQLLPSLQTFPCIKDIVKTDEGAFIFHYNSGNLNFFQSLGGFMPVEFIKKAILSSDPFYSKNNCSVIVIYGKESKLAFCMCGDTSWIELEGNHQPYRDIIFHDHSLFALADSGLVEVWDFNKSSPKKLMDLEAAFPVKTAETGWRLRDLYSTNFYLVESASDLLFVVRFIGNLVNEDGEAIHEAELFRDDSNHPLVCPYRTLFFHIYKLDINQRKYIEVNSLGDRVLFLGGNHSMSLSAQDFPECKRNSIYFTDDFWDQMDLDYLYGGHDMGVFNLEDQSIKPFYSCEMQKIVPPPFWVFPNLP